MMGLLKCERGKANMERMQEEIGDVEYHRYQHFISNSPWDHKAVITQVSKDADKVMQLEREKNNSPTGLFIDESGHIKKGNKSVGVARQYAGVVGKVENCQVGVYTSLCTAERSCLINERLFLPESWIKDKERCNEAGIPEEYQQYKSKLVLALEMIDEVVENEIYFDWVGGDGLYGNSYELGKGLEERNLLFVLDIHKDQHIYLEEPTIYLPEKKGVKGRSPTKLQSKEQSVRVDEYVKNLPNESWQKVRIRKGAKGWLTGWIHVKEVMVWDGEETQARKRTLIVRKSIDNKEEIKYSLSNGSMKQYSIEKFAYFQGQRYWVERDFKNGKSELGMSDYQVRKWLGWHHHHAIVFMAMLFMLQERIDHEIEYPLMSLRDARIIVTTLIAQTILESEPEMQRQLRLMEKRHCKRKQDIDRCYARDD
jgi:SRSO17 transposase